MYNFSWKFLKIKLVKKFAVYENTIHIYNICLFLEISEDKIGKVTGYRNSLPVLIFLGISRNNIGEKKIAG